MKKELQRMFLIFMVMMLATPFLSAGSPVLAVETAEIHFDFTKWSMRGDTQGASLTPVDEGLLLTGGNVFGVSDQSAPAAFTYEADITIAGAGTNASLMFHSSKSEWDPPRVEINAAEDKIALVNAGPYSDYAVPQGIQPGTAYHLKVAVDADQIRVYWNGSSEPVLTADNPTPEYGPDRVGIHLYDAEGDGEVKFDHLQLIGLEQDSNPDPSTPSDSWNSNLTGWVKQEGNDWSDDPDGKRISSLGKNTVMMAEQIKDDFVYEADITPKTLNGVYSLIFRSNSSGWGSYKLQLEPSKNELRLVDGGIHKTYNPAEPLQVDFTYHVKIVANASDIRVFFGDQTNPVLEGSSQTYLSGQLGLLVWDGEAIFQNVLVTDIEESVPDFATNLDGWEYSGDTGEHRVSTEGLSLASQGNYFALAAPVRDNFLYEADVTFADERGTGALVFRSNDNGWGSFMVQLDPAGDKIRLMNANDAAPGRLYAEQAAVIHSGIRYHVQIKADGSKLKVYWEHASDPILEADDSAYASGKLGLHIYNSNVTYQNVYVRDLNASYPEVITNLEGWSTSESGTLEETKAGMRLTSSGNFFALAGGEGSDFIYEADVALQEGGLASLVFRSSENGWEAYMLQIAADPNGTDRGVLRLKNANDQTPDALSLEQEVDLAKGGAMDHLKVVAEGTRLRVYWNNAAAPVMDVNDSAYSSGRFGLHVYNGSGLFQNIWVSSLNADYSGLNSNLTGWMIRESGNVTADSQGMRLSSGANVMALAEVRSGDFELEGDITLLTENAIGSLVIRSSANGRSAYLVQLDHRTQQVRLLETGEQGTPSLRIERPASLMAGTAYHLRVKAEGSSIKVYLNGKYNPLLTANSVKYSEGRAGLHAFGGSVQFQNVYISEQATNLPVWFERGGGDWQPDLRGIRGTAGADWGYRLAGTASGDIVLEGDITFDPLDPAASAALLLRTSPDDGDQGYMLELTAEGEFGLYEGLGGTGQLVASGSVPETTTRQYHLEAVMNGVHLAVYVNGYSEPVIEWDQVQFTDTGLSVGTAVRAGTAYFQNIYATPASQYYNEMYRQQVHYSPARGSASDPNGLVYFDGEYHLFHQDGGTWAHAISSDLLHWKRMPIALPWNDMGHIWSGSAVADLNNDSGLFGDAGGQGLIAYYTSYNPDKQGGNQKVGLAYSKDKGRTWQYYGEEAVVPNPGGPEGGWDFRDPKVIRDEANNRWVMVISGGDNIHFLISTDLIHWTRTDQFGFNEISVNGEWQEGVWECPDFFPLQVDGNGERKWVLMISTGAHVKTEGSSARYFIGQFTAEGKFVNDNPVRTILMTDFGKEMYASMSFDNVPDGRRIMLAWMTNWNYPFSFPTSGWQGQMTIPRELALATMEDGIRLVQQPVRELAALRGDPFTITDQTVVPGGPNLLSGISGKTYELEAEIELPEQGGADEFGFALREGGDQRTLVGYKADANVMYVDRSASGMMDFASGFTSYHEAPAEPKQRTISMRILVDESSVEVFGNDGEVVFSDLIFPDSARTGLSFYVKNGTALIKSLKFYPLSSVWSLAPDGNEQPRIVLDRSALELGAGEQRQVFAAVVPNAAPKPQLEWEVAQPEIARIVNSNSGSALIEGVAIGTTQLIARTSDGALEASMTVTVGSFLTNLTGWKAYPASQWVPTASGIRGSYGTDANYMAAVQAADFTYEAEIKLTSKGAGSVLFRANRDGSAGYYFNLDPNMRNIRLFYKASGKADVESRQVLATVPMNFVIGKIYKATITATGSHIQIWLDGNRVIDIHDSTYNQGYFGLNVFDGQIYYQNVRVSDSTPADSSAYRLINLQTGQALSTDTQNNGSSIRTGTAADSDSQYWTYFELEDGIYTVRAAKSGKSIDWDVGRNAVQLYPYLGYNNQRWQMIAHEDGTVSFLSAHDRLHALSADAEGRVRLEARDDQEPSQKWRLEVIVSSEPPEQPEPEGPDSPPSTGLPASSSSSGDKLSDSSEAAVSFTVNGRSASFATVTNMMKGSRHVSEIDVDAEALMKQLSRHASSRIEIRLSDSRDLIVKGLSLADLKKIWEAEYELVVSSSYAIIPLRADRLRAQFGGASLANGPKDEEIQVELSISASSPTAVSQARSASAAQQFMLVSEPVNMTISMLHEGELLNVGTGLTMVTLPLPADWKGDVPVTALAIMPNGQTEPLPAALRTEGERSYADLSGIFNEADVFLASHTAKFDDMEHHWAAAPVLELGNRMMVQGDPTGSFQPNRRVSRSEYAAMLVRGLGLMPSGVQAEAFADLNPEAWDYKAVRIARQYGIVSGYDDGLFRGAQTITREQGMVALYQAIEMIEGSPLQVHSDERDKALSAFKDGSRVSGWAQEAAAYLIQRGIIQGDSLHMLHPGETLTRAEAAVLIERMLIICGLIN